MIDEYYARKQEPRYIVFYMNNNLKEFYLIKSNYATSDFILSEVTDFENEILSLLNNRFVSAPSQNKMRYYHWLDKFNKPIQNIIPSKKNFISIGGSDCIIKSLPFIMMNSRVKAIWMYDLWEPNYQKLEKWLRKYKINILFTSSQQAFLHFNNLGIKNFHSNWVAEAINQKNYFFNPYNDKQIDILNFGRGWTEHHLKIFDYCNSAQIKYLNNYVEAHPDKWLPIFTNNELKNYLANSKICICVPAILTKPHYTGNISTTTLRYFQAMASKCLILGISPLDIKYIFKYNPIIEIDINEPVKQIQNILNNFSDYIPLIEKNYNEIIQNHQWKNRAVEIINHIEFVYNNKN